MTHKASLTAPRGLTKIVGDAGGAGGLSRTRERHSVDVCAHKDGAACGMLEITLCSSVRSDLWPWGAKHERKAFTISHCGRVLHDAMYAEASQSEHGSESIHYLPLRQGSPFQPRLDPVVLNRLCMNYIPLRQGSP